MDKTYEQKESQSLIATIATAHAQRLGWWKTLSGGFAMYISIPVWVVLHITLATILYQKILAPLLKLPTLDWKNYLIFDRHRIDGLILADRFNCLFCAYANGLTVMLNEELNNVASFQGTLSATRYLLFMVVGLLTVPFLLLGELMGIQFCYNLLVAPPLGLRRSSFHSVKRHLEQQGFAGQFPTFSREVLLLAKTVFFRFSLLLEQIESSWCPLHHLNKREGIIRPKHHDRFFEAHQLEQMFQVLATDGTVSVEKPLSE